MRLLLPILCVLVPLLASKERLPLENLQENEKSLLFELVKRLGKGSDYELGWIEKAQSSRCKVSTQNSSIIKRIDSENNGAKFLTLHDDVETNEKCSDLCCRNSSCDLAVYENKGEHHCYLFQCEGKCLFGHHSSYISNTIDHRIQLPPSAADGSELDLINLDQDSDTVGNDKEDSFPPTTPATSTLAPPTPAPYIRAHSVGLEGPYCQRDLHCEDPNAVCNYHKCRCREGYYQKGHICRQNCPPSNFGCLELGTLGRGPQCVSASQVCDSVMQCADGSDEFNCPDSGVPPIRTWPQQQQHQMPAAQDSQQQQQQQQEQQPPLLPGQQQSYPQGYNEPNYGYSEQGMMAPDHGQGHPSDTRPYQPFPEDPRYSQSGDANYASYNPQPEQPQQPYMFPGSGQFQGGSAQSPASANPGSDAKYGNPASEQYPVKGAQGTSNKESGLAQRKPLPSNQQQPPKVPQKAVLSQGQSPASSQQDVHHPDPQAGDNKVPYPQLPQQIHQKTSPQKMDSNTQSQQSPDQSESKPFYQHGQQPAGQQPAIHQSLPNQPQSYQHAGPEHIPASKVNGAAQQTEHTPASDSNPPVKSDSGVAYESAQSQPSKIFMEGGSSKHSQSVGSAANHFQAAKQDTPSNTGLHSDPNAQSASSGASHPGRPASHPGRPNLSLKPESMANNPAEGRKASNTSPNQNEGQKPYVDAGHSKVQGNADPAYHLPQANVKPEPLHPHSAYDVRIGEPGAGRHQSDVGQQIFNPTELNNLDGQGPSHYLDTFSNSYLPGQGYGQQYNQYGRYPGAYAPNSGNQAGNFGGLPEQLYPGGQGQRVYPQQSYLDLGYQSPQYEFGELDPAYSETDGFPGNHDVPSYRPGSKLGYDGPYKSPEAPAKDSNPPQQDDKTGRHGDRPVEKPDSPSRAYAKVPEHAGDVSTSDDKGKLDTQPPSSSKDTENKNKDDHKKPADGTKETPQKTPVKDGSAKDALTDNADGFPEPKGDNSDLAKGSSMQEPTPFEKSSDTEDLIQRQNDFISKVKLDTPKEPANMQGPIIALSLGLAFTVILLIFVACRLRMVRRRLRKGRPLHSNEADYLINGMYL